jgi:ethanolamine utilization protein EutP (predicted NTPase)
MIRIVMDTDALNRILGTPGLLREIQAVVSHGDLVFLSNDVALAPRVMTTLGAVDIFVTTDSDPNNITADQQCSEVWTFEQFVEFVKQCHHGTESEEG